MKYFDNPSFREYVSLLGELHGLIRDGRDESPEGEALRDRMDEPGAELDGDEIAEATEIAADFYQFSEPHTWRPKLETELSKAAFLKAEEASRDGEWPLALHLFREWSAYCEPDELASLRSELWSSLGFHDISASYLNQDMYESPEKRNERCRSHDIADMSQVKSAVVLDELMAS